MKIRLSIVAAAIVGLAAAPAFAASSSSASIGPLSIQLFDLNPLDNVTPWIAFTNSGAGQETYVYANAYQSTPYAFDQQQTYGATPWGPVAASATAGVAQATAAITGPDAGNGTTLSASGSSADFVGVLNTDYATYNAYAYAPSQATSGGFTLSANTVVVISGAANVAAAGTTTYNPVYYYGDYAQSNVSLSVSGPAGGGGGSQSASDSIGVSGYTYNYGTAFNFTDSRALAVSFVNLTSGDLAGNLQVSTSAYGYTYANPVPEPETYALMLSGLAAMGLLVRRRRG